MYERRRGGFGRDGGGFGGGRRDDFDKPKPVKIGEEYDVKITDVGAKGDGITKIENFIVFVHGTKKGEECRVRIKEVAHKFAIAEKIGSSESEEAGPEEKEATEEAEPVEETEQEEEKEEEEKEEEM